MTDNKNNTDPAMNDESKDKTADEVKSIQELRPALDKEEIEKAVESAGPDRKDIMDKLDQKDHQ